MEPEAVVVTDEDLQYALEMATVDDEQMIETLAPHNLAQRAPLFLLRRDVSASVGRAYVLHGSTRASRCRVAIHASTSSRSNRSRPPTL
jgi:hypothetical protein